MTITFPYLCVSHVSYFFFLSYTLFGFYNINNFIWIFGLYNLNPLKRMNCIWIDIKNLWWPKNMHSNFKEHMNGYQWPWYHETLITTHKKENFRIDENWKMNENFEWCNVEPKRVLYNACESLRFWTYIRVSEASDKLKN
jgi:hypothetical protein